MAVSFAHLTVPSCDIRGAAILTGAVRRRASPRHRGSTRASGAWARTGRSTTLAGRPCGPLAGGQMAPPPRAAAVGNALAVEARQVPGALPRLRPWGQKRQEPGRRSRSAWLSYRRSWPQRAASWPSCRRSATQAPAPSRPAVRRPTPQSSQCSLASPARTLGIVAVSTPIPREATQSQAAGKCVPPRI